MPCVAFGDEARVGADGASRFARAVDVVAPKQTLVGEPPAMFFAHFVGDCHAASSSCTKRSRFPADVSVKTRLARPRGRTTTTSNASARPRASASRMVRRPARPRNTSPRRSKTTRLGPGASLSRSSACSTDPTPAPSKSPVSLKRRVLSDSSTARIKGPGTIRNLLRDGALRTPSGSPPRRVWAPRKGEEAQESQWQRGVGRAYSHQAPQTEIPNFGSGLWPQSARTLARTRSEAERTITPDQADSTRTSRSSWLSLPQAYRSRLARSRLVRVRTPRRQDRGRCGSGS
jgi:hypothetical protein